MTTTEAIKFTTEASPLPTEKKIKRMVANLLNEGRSQHYTPEWIKPVDVTEGAEKCGYGDLHISGIVEHWNGFATVRYSLDSKGSQWRNYGAPHGTKYDVVVTLVTPANE